MPKDDAECKCGHMFIEHGVDGACDALEDEECACEEFTPV